MAKKSRKDKRAPKRRRLRASIKEVEGEIRLLLRQRRDLEHQLAKLSHMKKGGGRGKGSSFERAVAKMVLKTFPGFSAKDCYRTPLSGGHFAASKNDPGDLVMSPKLRQLFPFSVECKSYKELPLETFWLPETKRKGLINGWLKQCVKACNGSFDKKQPGDQLYPLLIMKGNRGRIFCALPGLYPQVTQIKHKLRIRYNKKEWFVLLFQDLLTAFKNKEN